MRRPNVLFLPATAALVLLTLTSAPAQSPAPYAQSAARIILSLGNDQFIPKAAIEGTTGARFQSDFAGLRFLDEVSVIVLADIGFAQLPPLLQSSLVRWVELGGSLLVTGGDNSFGLGGYAGSSLAPLFPLVPNPSDRTNHSFSPTYILNQSHPIFGGVTTSTMAIFNETALAGDAALLLEYRGVSKGGFAGAGMTGSGKTFVTTINPVTKQAQVTFGTPAQSLAGQVTNPVTGTTVQAGPGSGTASTGPGGTGQGTAAPGVTSTGEAFNPTFASEGGLQGGGRAPMPLIAERRHGNGLVLGIALDMNATGEWQDRTTLTTNAIRYLLDQSKLPLSR